MPAPCCGDLAGGSRPVWVRRAGERFGNCALRHALRYYATMGVTIRCVFTDIAPCYRSRVFALACHKTRYAESLYTALHASHQRRG